MMIRGLCASSRAGLTEREIEVGLRNIHELERLPFLQPPHPQHCKSLDAVSHDASASHAGCCLYLCRERACTSLCHCCFHGSVSGSFVTAHEVEDDGVDIGRRNVSG